MSEHYKLKGGNEAIDVIEDVIERKELSMAQAWCVGNALKYLLRLGKKDDTAQEIFKAENYLHRARTGKWIEEEGNVVR